MTEAASFFFVNLSALVASIPSPSSNSFDLGPLTFRYYGLTIALGVLAAVEIGRVRWVARGGDADDIIELAKWAVPAGLIGARMYHVMTDWRRYQGRWFDSVKIWEGGLGIPGGLLLGVAVGVWVARRNGWNVTALADAVIPGIPVAQAIGRLGNWFNQEIYGRPTDVPWAVEIDNPSTEFEGFTTFHPTFLYEALLNLLIAGSLIFADKKKWLKPGAILPLWITLYGVARFIVEGMRTDEASEIAGIRVNHWVSGAAIIIGGLWFLAVQRRSTEEEVAAPDVDPDDPVAGESVAEQVVADVDDDEAVIDAS
jgi:prolipoprotein diacylglyceryl transferase